MDKYVIVGSVILINSLFINIAYQNRESDGELKPIFDDIAARDLYVELPDIDRQHPLLQGMAEACENYVITITIEYEMELTYLGTYFITAYCPAECGDSWSTASGETCHRADWENRLTEPTTCAISRSIHSFGDQFYIEEFDRTFVAEDTGPGVQGKHLDLFYEDYDDVLNFPTGYYDVYSVEWVEIEIVKGDWQ